MLHFHYRFKIKKKLFCLCFYFHFRSLVFLFPLFSVFFNSFILHTGHECWHFSYASVWTTKNSFFVVGAYNLRLKQCKGSDYGIHSLSNICHGFYEFYSMDFGDGAYFRFGIEHFQFVDISLQIRKLSSNKLNIWIYIRFNKVSQSNYGLFLIFFSEFIHQWILKTDCLWWQMINRNFLIFEIYLRVTQLV